MADAPPVDPAVGAEVPGPVAGGLLPRRVRQANLAPQLRAAAVDPAEGERAAAARERSPEEARAAFSSFQRGFSRGRAEPGPVVPAPDIPSAGPAGYAPPPLATRRALAPSPVPPALPVAPSPAPPAPAEGS
ncbi:hypothetical protein C7C46_21885 [Streptomyces tateyamensis]|uniref:Uncharacterized protein n=1 Tax=Streptomyces tateyamensis TaxID=565073 RepID=A0A2V4NLV5_9ACTN|nr:hypothetical protein C7C46_21885 [Streptomyces tateyamensis]